MSAPSKPTPSWVTVYAGQVCIGHAIHRGKIGFEALDRDDRPIGLFLSLGEAASALEQLARQSWATAGIRCTSNNADCGAGATCVERVRLKPARCAAATSKGAAITRIAASAGIFKTKEFLMSKELFVMVSHSVLESKAWRTMSTGARCLYFELKRFYRSDLKNNGKIFLSQRDAAEKTGRTTKQITRWFRELQHFSFIVETQPSQLGSDGIGRAPRWRLTEVGYMKDPPTRDYLRWDGKRFKEGANPSTRKRKRSPIEHCRGCGVEFRRTRNDAKYCSSSCRGRSYRANGKQIPVGQMTDAHVRQMTDSTVSQMTDSETYKRQSNDRHGERLGVGQITYRSSIPSSRAHWLLWSTPVLTEVPVSEWTDEARWVDWPPHKGN